jgi:ceramide glucosyltransferase
METIILLLIAISLSMNVLYTSVTTYYSNKNTMNFPDKKYPSVTILKPVKGIDDEMEKNLESFFKLDYPDFEILFGVDSKKDEVTGLIAKVMKRFPNVDAKIIETGHRGDQNPKVYKLSFMEKFSQGSLFWISDSNIRVENNTLKSLAEEYILNGTHLIFSPIRATGSRTFGSLIENSYMNHYLSGNVLGAWVLFRKEVVVGKSMLIEKKALRSFGGFPYFKDYLAEDQILGETFRNSGYLISTNNTWVTNFNSSSTTKSFYSLFWRDINKYDCSGYSFCWGT